MPVPQGLNSSQDPSQGPGDALGTGSRGDSRQHLSILFSLSPSEQNANVFNFSYFTVAAFNSCFIKSEQETAAPGMALALNEERPSGSGPHRQSVSPSDLLEPQVHEERRRPCTHMHCPQCPVQSTGSGPRRAGVSAIPRPPGPVRESTDPHPGSPANCLHTPSSPYGLPVGMGKEGCESLIQERPLKGIPLQTEFRNNHTGLRDSFKENTTEDM